MKYTYLSVLFLFVSFSAVSYGQKAERPSFKKVTKTNSVQKQNSQNLYHPIKISSTTPKNKSPYYWNEEVVLEKLNVNTIPSDYPKYDKNVSKEANIIMIDEWIIKNNHLIKEKYKTLYK